MLLLNVSPLVAVYGFGAFLPLRLFIRFSRTHIHGFLSPADVSFAFRFSLFGLLGEGVHSHMRGCDAGMQLHQTPGVVIGGAESSAVGKLLFFALARHSILSDGLLFRFGEPLPETFFGRLPAHAQSGRYYR